MQSQPPRQEGGTGRHALRRLGVRRDGNPGSLSTAPQKTLLSYENTGRYGPGVALSPRGRQTARQFPWPPCL